MINATEKLIELYQLIRDEYQDVLTKEDLSTIYYTLGNRIDVIIEEEQNYTLDNGL